MALGDAVLQHQLLRRLADAVQRAEDDLVAIDRLHRMGDERVRDVLFIFRRHEQAAHFRDVRIGADGLQHAQHGEAEYPARRHHVRRDGDELPIAPKCQHRQRITSQPIRSPQIPPPGAHPLVRVERQLDPEPIGQRDPLVTELFERAERAVRLDDNFRWKLQISKRDSSNRGTPGHGQLSFQH